MRNMIWLRSCMLVAAVSCIAIAVPPGRRRIQDHEVGSDFPETLSNQIDNNLSNERNVNSAYVTMGGSGIPDSEPRKWFEAIISGSGTKLDHSGEHPHRRIRMNGPTTGGIALNPPINREASSHLAQTLGKLKRMMFNNENSRLIPMNVSELRPSFCTIKPFQQTISHPGCEPVTIQNHMCYGQCDSFYLPFVDNKFVSCAACAPSRFETEFVELPCPDAESEEIRVVRKSVEIIHKCDCLPCPTSRAPMEEGQ